MTPVTMTPADLAAMLGLPEGRYLELVALAEARGSEPEVLVRAWVLEQLDGAAAFRDRASERWARDFRATTEHLRTLLDEHPDL